MALKSTSIGIHIGEETIPNERAEGRVQLHLHCCPLQRDFYRDVLLTECHADYLINAHSASQAQPDGWWQSFDLEIRVSKS